MTDYTELIRQLKTYEDGYGLYDAAADAIEALQAKLPKRGKWIGVSPMVDTVQCSVCGGQLFSAELETPYCPYCGAEMIGEQNEEDGGQDGQE